MDSNELATHQILQRRWEAYKKRFGIAGFVDEHGQPIPEFLLTDAHKRILMGESSKHDNDAAKKEKREDT